MNIKKALIVGATVATVTLGGGGIAMAATDTSSDGTTKTSIVDKLASKFGLNKSEVQAVFDADRTEMEANRAADQKERLAQAVTGGKLTQEQADYITKAQAEIETLRGDSTPDDEDSTVRDQVRTKMDALRTWAEDNDVDMKYVMGGHGHGGPGGPRFGKPGDDGNRSSDDTSTEGSTTED